MDSNSELAAFLHKTRGKLIVQAEAEIALKRVRQYLSPSDIFYIRALCQEINIKPEDINTSHQELDALLCKGGVKLAQLHLKFARNGINRVQIQELYKYRRYAQMSWRKLGSSRFEITFFWLKIFYAEGMARLKNL